MKNCRLKFSASRYSTNYLHPSVVPEADNNLYKLANPLEENKTEITVCYEQDWKWIFYFNFNYTLS